MVPNDEDREQWRRDKMQDLSEAVAVLKAQVQHLREDVGKCVTKIEFSPVRLLTFGLAGTLLVAVISAIVAQVIRH